jgi:TP901 family phage tail tape measure protein
MGQLDALHVDISLRGHTAAMTALNGFKSYLGGLKANLIAVGAASGAGFSLMTVKLAADLEQSRLLLKRFVDTDFSNLTNGIDQLATKIPIAVGGLYDIASGAAQVGVTGTKNILAFTEVVGKLATVSSMSFNETAKDLAKLHNVFGLKPDQSFRTANVIAGLSAASAADPSELITTTRYLSGAASTIQFTLDQTIALAAAIKDAGISSEVGGTAFNKLILDMAKMPEAFAEISDMSASEFKKLRDTNPMKALVTALKSIASEPSIEDKVAKSERIGVESVRQSGALLQLIKALELFEQHLGRAAKFGDEKKELDKQFNTQAESTYSQLQKLGNAFTLFAGELENSSLNIIKPASQALSGAFLGLTATMRDVKELFGGDPQAPARPHIPVGLFDGMFMLLKNMNLPKPAPAVGGDLRVVEKDKIQEAVKAAEKEERVAAENLGVKNQEIEDRKKLNAKIEEEANEFAKGIKDPNDEDAARKLTNYANSLAQGDKLIADAQAEIPALEAALAAAKAKVAKAGESPEAKAAAEKQGFNIKQGGRKFAFDELVDPQAFDQFEQAYNSLPTELWNSDAGKALRGKMFARHNADVAKNLTEDELTQLIQKRAGAIGNVANAVAQEKAQRLNARATFQGADESWKRIQSGAMEGDPMTRILKENARLHKETTKAVQALQAAVDAGRAEIKDNVIMLVGG